MDLENKYGTLEIQRGCIRLLKIFHALCIANGVRYSIAYGTLLGAVRHKGFIPWDDDVDVIMDRMNYAKLLQALEECPDLKVERALWIDKVTLVSSDFSGSYPPTIDLFLMDHSPEGKFGYYFKLYIIYFLQGMIKPSLSLKKGNMLMKFFSVVTWLIGRLFSHKKKLEWYQGVSQWCNQRPTQFEQCYNTLFSYIHCRFKAGLLDDIVTVPFEDTSVYAMSDYDSFLSAQYGDYMTPPKEKSPSHLTA